MDWFRRHNFFKTSRPAAASAPAATATSLQTKQWILHDLDISRDCDVEKFFIYTSGRWLWNEEYQLARRYVKFNIPELLKISSQTTGARSCIKIQKLPEGNFSKAFLITLDDGREVIAKLPNPNAGPAYFTTASEVATMDYVRNVLKIPAPKVFAWSSSADNPVGAEYILMERSRGVELGKVWDDMSWEQRFEIVKALVEYEKAFASTRLPMYGSLYYAEDLPSSNSSQNVVLEGTPENKAFTIGPTTNRAFFDNGRDGVEVDRGPWPSLKDFVLSRAHRELECLNKFSAFPSQQGLFNGPNQYNPTKALKVEVLQNYMKVAKHILPDDPDLSNPTLWHSDLHADNIFVDPDQPTKILNVIDWQVVNVSPLFLQVRHPSLIEFEGPIPEGLEPIELPDDFDKMSAEEQQQAKNLRAAQSLYKLYEILMLRQCPEIGRALRFRESLAGQITGLSSSIFSDGEPILQGMLIRLQDEWSTYVGPSIPCPLSFSAEDRVQQQEHEARWSAGVELMHEVLTEVGAYQGWDGWVNHSNYTAYKERLAQCRESFLNSHAANDEERRQWAQAWPFEGKSGPSAIPSISQAPEVQK